MTWQILNKCFKTKKKVNFYLTNEKKKKKTLSQIRRLTTLKQNKIYDIHQSWIEAVYGILYVVYPTLTQLINKLCVNGPNRGSFIICCLYF